MFGNLLLKFKNEIQLTVVRKFACELLTKNEMPTYICTILIIITIIYNS